VQISQISLKVMQLTLSLRSQPTRLRRKPITVLALVYEMGSGEIQSVRCNNPKKAF
jgi:hypothetical protein